MIRDDRLLLAELSRLNTDVVPLALRIMDQSATPEEHHAFADRLIAMAHQLQARAAGPALVIGAELDAYQYSHREDPLGDEADLEEVEVEIAHPLSVSMSFRLPPEEASAIRAAAERAGMSMSDWIRGVCAAAQADTSVDTPVPRQRVNIAKARRLLAELDRELNRAVERANE